MSVSLTKDISVVKTPQNLNLESESFPANSGGLLNLQIADTYVESAREHKKHRVQSGRVKSKKKGAKGLTQIKSETTRNANYGLLSSTFKKLFDGKKSPNANKN